MLAGWQLNDVEMMHKYYDDNVTAISGVWEPPLVGLGGIRQLLQSAARAHQRWSAGTDEHLYQSDGRFRVGHLPVALQWCG